MQVRLPQRSRRRARFFLSTFLSSLRRILPVLVFCVWIGVNSTAAKTAFNQSA